MIAKNDGIFLAIYIALGFYAGGVDMVKGIYESFFFVHLYGRPRGNPFQNFLFSVSDFS